MTNSRPTAWKRGSERRGVKERRRLEIPYETVALVCGHLQPGYGLIVVA